MPTRSENENALRLLHLVVTIASVIETSALGMHAVKHTWLTSAEDTAASSKAQWRRFRERALTGFICQMAPVVWDLSMAYALAHIASDAQLDFDLTALKFLFVNQNFLEEIVCPTWCWQHVHGRDKSAFTFVDFFADAALNTTIGELSLEHLGMYSVKARTSFHNAMLVLIYPEGMIRDMYQDTELVDGQFDPILGLCHIAYHFISLGDDSSLKSAYAIYLAIRPTSRDEHMRDYIKRYRRAVKDYNEELEDAGSPTLATQSVRDHLKFTIEEALGNMYRMVFFENNRPCRRNAELIKFINALMSFSDTEMGHKGDTDGNESTTVSVAMFTSDLATAPPATPSRPRQAPHARTEHPTGRSGTKGSQQRQRSVTSNTSRSGQRPPRGDSRAWSSGLGNGLADGKPNFIRININRETKLPEGPYQDGMPVCALNVGTVDRPVACGKPHYHHVCPRGKQPPVPRELRGQSERGRGRGPGVHLITFADASAMASLSPDATSDHSDSEDADQDTAVMSAKLYEYETDEYSNDEDTEQYTYADGEYDTGTDTDDATASTQMAVYNVH